MMPFACIISMPEFNELCFPSTSLAKTCGVSLLGFPVISTSESIFYTLQKRSNKVKVGTGSCLHILTCQRLLRKRMVDLLTYCPFVVLLKSPQENPRFLFQVKTIQKSRKP